MKNTPKKYKKRDKIIESIDSSDSDGFNEYKNKHVNNITNQKKTKNNKMIVKNGDKKIKKNGIIKNYKIK